MPIPKSMSKKERAWTVDEKLKHVKKPDVDNLLKLYLDVLTGIVWEDDNCVSLKECVKVYSNNPRTEIFISESDKFIQ